MFYIDVSHYDYDRAKGALDWSIIKSSGIDVVFIRATYGDPLVYNPDTRYFEEMALRAKQAGLRVGGYHNLINGDSASLKRQVEYFRSALDNVGADYAMVDVEPYDALKNNNLWPRLAAAEGFAREFMQQDKRRNLAVYLAQWVWSGWLDKSDLRPLMSYAKGPLVNASYPAGSTAGSATNLYAIVKGDQGVGWASYGNVAPEIWQYSSNSSVAGASSVTDINAFRGSLSDLDQRLTRKDIVMSAIEDVLWPGMKALEPKSLLGGIYANKRGYHNRRNNLPMPGYDTDYSVDQFSIDKQGPGDEASAIDWTFPDAQNGNYATISKYSKRLYAARLNEDPRTVYMREFFGQIDSDSTVEGWDYSKNKASSSDSSHLWHIHISVHRKYINSTAAMRAILSILKGQSVEDWKAENARNVTFEIFSGSLPVLKKGDSDPIIKGGDTTYVKRLQRYVLVDADGDYGPATAAAVKGLDIADRDGSYVDFRVWEKADAIWSASKTTTYKKAGNARDVTFERFENAKLPILRKGDSDEAGGVDGSGVAYIRRAQRQLRIDDDGEYGPATAAAVKEVMNDTVDGNTINNAVWRKLFAIWDLDVEGTVIVDPSSNSR